MNMSGCMFQVNVFEAREEMKVSGAAVVQVDNCVQCAKSDENQAFETDLGSRLGYLFVIVSSLFLKRGSHSTATMLPRNIHLHNIFSQCRPVLQ